MNLSDRVDTANKLIAEAYELLGWNHPVGKVQWVHIDKVKANDYNPNAVAHHEMRLLYTSIYEDGFTQPIVTVYDRYSKLWIIVDGFHRYTVAKKFPDILERSEGYLPIVVIDKGIEGRIASTVRHNRARGKHSVEGMSSLVFQLLKEGVTDAEICNKIGLEAEELSRLKHITGYAKLYENHEYTTPTLSASQMKFKAEYQKENPNEQVPNNF